MPAADRLSDQLDQLANFDSSGFPVISLYLNLTANQHGRDQFGPFLRKELNDRLRTYRAEGPERKSLEQDAERIREYLATVDRSANGLALFASSGATCSTQSSSATPIPAHRLYISDHPHLYPLARVLDASPRYAVVMANTRTARIFVVAANTLTATEELEGVKTKRHKMGGWAQARYQRHVDNYHAQHAKEVVTALARVVRDEEIGAVLIGGDEVIVPLLKEHLPKDLAARVVDVLKLDIRAPERDILDTTLAAMREQDAQTDRGKVNQAISAYRAHGLGVVGVEPTLRALEGGQVDELLLTADTPDPNRSSERPAKRVKQVEERTAERLIVKARLTAATIRFIEDPTLLADVGGVGALLRFTVDQTTQTDQSHTS